jgi:L-asparaginase
VSSFKNKLTASENENATTLKNYVIRDYDELSAEESYFEGNMSSVLLCFIDDEFFYDTNCRAIWSAFTSRQRNIEAQLIFPVLIEDVITTNFDPPKKEIYATAKALGFYAIIDDDELSTLCADITASLQKIDKNAVEVTDMAGNVVTNVHPVCAIESKLIDDYQKCNEEKVRTERIRKLKLAYNSLATSLTENYARIKHRKYPDTKGVCVLYTGGTAGMIHDTDSLELIQANLWQLIPKLPRLKRETFEIDFYSFEKPLDSSNISSGHWLIMAAVIQVLKNNYQGFVIIHGANTMAYSAAALSFLLDNVDRPIILTGSELGLTELNTDAEQNIQRSVEIAAYRSRSEENVRDVCILFGRRLIRGNRATKQIALDTTEGFYSPNYPELASVSHDRVVIDSSRLKVDAQKINNNASLITTNDNIASEPRIVICDIYPDMDMDMFQANCLKPEVGAVIIRTYGTGGVPDQDKKFKGCLETLKNENKIVVNLTQCPKGNVELRIFETNATLFNLGVISGGDMVTEAAYCKLKHLFSKFEGIADAKKKVEIIRHYMMVSMHDELTMSTFTVRFGNENQKMRLNQGVEGITLTRNSAWSANPAAAFNNDDCDFSEDSFAKFDATAHITSAVLRLSGVHILNGFTRPVQGGEDGLTEVNPGIVVSLSNEQPSTPISKTDQTKSGSLTIIKT